jgi:acetyl esterase/lipase
MYYKLKQNIFYRLVVPVILIIAVMISLIPISAKAASPPPNLYYTTAKSTLKNPNGSIKTNGIMILIHGGGWQGTGQGAVDGLKRWADRYNSLGWATLNVDYRPYANSVNDVAQWYDWMNSAFGSQYPICAMGQSAGGHLALLLSVKRSDLECVVSQAGPTDLPNLNAQPGAGYQAVYDLAVKAFGASNLYVYSPIAWASYGLLSAKVLQADTIDDQLVHISQQRNLAAKLPGSIAIELPGSTLTSDPAFGHSRTTWPALGSYLQQEQTFLNGITRR